MVRLDRAFHDGKPETGAFHLKLRVMFFYPVEPAENMWEIRAGNSDAVVLHPDQDIVPALRTADLDLQILVGVLFQRVLDEIEQHLRPVETVSLKGDFVIVKAHGNIRLLAADDGFEALQDILHA